MEPFLRLVVGGGLSLLAGLWTTALAGHQTPLWAGGLGLAVLGTAALAAGIWREVDRET